MPSSQQLKIPEVEIYEDLSANHQAFIDYYISSGDAEAAAYRAGYRERTGKNGLTLAYKARKLRNGLAHIIDQKVEEYARGADMKVLAVTVLKQLAEGAESETVRLNAAKEIANRTMASEASKREITHKVQISSLTDEALDARIAKLKAELNDNVIDVTPEEVTDA
jgi:phage terminase small subunit